MTGSRVPLICAIANGSTPSSFRNAVCSMGNRLGKTCWALLNQNVRCYHAQAKRVPIAPGLFDLPTGSVFGDAHSGPTLLTEVSKSDVIVKYEQNP